MVWNCHATGISAWAEGVLPVLKAGLSHHLHGLTYHIYADDSQLYLVIRQDDDLGAVTSRIENCVSGVQRWMSTNMLKLNESKTEIIVFSSCRKQDIMNNISFKFGDSVIFPVTKVKNLGVFFNSHLSMESQVLSVERACFFQIRNLHRVRRYLTKDVCKMLVIALIISCLDYGNSLLAGLPKCLLQRLQ